MKKLFTLMVMGVFVMMLLAPQGARAITMTYDFNALAKAAYSANNNSAGPYELTMGATYSGITASQYGTSTTFGSVTVDMSKFAWRMDTRSTNPRGWWLYTSDYNNNLAGMLFRYTTPEFALTNLKAGDEITIYCLASASNRTANITFVSGSAETTSGAAISANTTLINSTGTNEQSVTIKASAKGDIILKTAADAWHTIITKIVIYHDDNVASYNYVDEPAVESYDFYWVDENTTYTTTDADFTLNTTGEKAHYLKLNSGIALNNRIAVSSMYYNGHYYTTEELWSFPNNDNGNESQGLKVNFGWHNLSICNLLEGDRVRITYSGSATFSSASQNSAYNGCSAFKDITNDGVFSQEEGDRYVTAGLTVEGTNANGVITSYIYTIAEDGHLDIALSEGSRLCKVEIFIDRQATMLDRDNQTTPPSFTSYFSNTGQLEAKQHVVPGGLEVRVGNDDATQRAMVVQSTEGPVSYIYDEEHRKMPNTNSNSFDVMSRLPEKGTYYKFIPQVDGTMTVNLQAVSVNYHDWSQKGNVAFNQYGQANEYYPTVACPYYLMVQPGQNGATFSQAVSPQSKSNGEVITFSNIQVKAGNTYYIYGWWNDNTNAGNFQQSSHACGVAQLLDVTFTPDKYLSRLAKWVENGTTADNDLANVTGYTQVTIKEMSSGISGCNATISGGKLQISNVTFSGDNHGGTILIKLGDPSNKFDPVFAYTIAYSADVDDSESSRGHTWDFSSNSLRGLEWTNTSTYADITDFGTYYQDYFNDNLNVNNQSLLYREMTGLGVNGEVSPDWLFNYRVKKTDGTISDPRFLNKYDMEGDNADMIWDTEGLIFITSSNQSCIFNEYKSNTTHNTIDRTNKTQKDPDRYVGVLPGGKFIIPQLKANDRVIIYMGSGDGSGSESMRFNITNALDAMHKSINSEYWAGGSMWNTYDAHNDPYYRGCYHFYAAADGDMEFEMTTGSMCKIYSIQIYRGDRIETNEAHEAGNGYFMLSTKGDANGQTNSWNLHYRGKGERIAADAGSGKYSQKNEVIAKSGNITNTTLTSNTDNNLVSYTNNVGEFGMLRIRMKCMEFNSDYVTDFADRNITVAYHETMDYPYTWDFTDMRGFSNDAIEGEVAKSNYSIDENSTAINSWENASERDLSLWDENGMKVNSQISDPHNYNYIFENGRDFGGHQLWAGNNLIPETKGLWFYMENNGSIYNGNMKIMTDGLHLVNGSNQDWWNYKMVIPSVPANAAVYLRMARDKENVPDGAVDVNGDAYLKKAFQWGTHYYDGGNYGQYMTQIADATNCRFYQVDPSDENSDWIVALKNTSGATSNLILQLNGYVLKKLSVSTDPKAIGKTGYATESRARDIDHNLTSYLTGKPIKAYTATITADYDHVVLSQVGAADNGEKIMPAATNGDKNGCILYHDGGTANSDGTTNRTVSILDGGFHVFVPDMHDKDNTSLKATTTSNVMKSFNPVNDLYNVSAMTTGYLSPTDGNNTNLILTSKKYNVNDGPSTTLDDSGYDVFFVRVDPNGNGGNGATLKKCSAYIQIPTKDMVKLRTSSSDHGAKMSIVFADDWFGEINNGIATGIDQVTSNKSQVTSAEWYNLNGQKLNGMPTEKGLYIVNGRKVMIK